MRRRPNSAGLLTWIMRLALVGSVTLLVFLVYGFGRTESGPIDRSITQKLGYFLRALIVPGMLVGLFVAPSVMIFQVWRRSDRPRNRLSSGLCPTCAYPLTTNSSLCPECGEAAMPPPLSEWSVAWLSFRSVGLLLLVGALLGAIPAEVLIELDEQAFKSEAAAATKPYWRSRHGPFYGEMSCDQQGLLWVVDD